VSIGFDIVTAFEDMNDIDEIRARLATIHTANQLAGFVTQVFDFMHNVAEGDWVITNNPKRRVYRLGVVRSMATFDEENVGHHYFRNIEWKESEISFDSVDQQTRASINQPKTVFPVTGSIDASPEFSLESRWWRFKVNQFVFWPDDVIQAFEKATDESPEAGPDYRWYVEVDGGSKPIKRVFEQMRGGPYPRNKFTPRQVMRCFDKLSFRTFDRTVAGNGATPKGSQMTPLNTILYGPPGTGKTYQCISRAVLVCDGTVDDDRDEVVSRYQDLVREGRISFVTFHQSFSYEDFVEGIRPVTNAEGMPPSYPVLPGIFRRACEAANAHAESVEDIFSAVIDAVKKAGTDGLSINTKLGSPGWLQCGADPRNIQYKNSNGEAHQLLAENFKELWKKRHEITSVGDVNQSTERNLKGLNSYYWALLDFAKGLAMEAEQPSSQPYVLIIDEINRANISKVFGELITLIEEDKRLGADNALTVTLPYSGERFGIPSNLYIIGTMNTADRSIALLDIALRRRFDFEEIEPDPSLLPTNIEGVDLCKLLTAINQRIEFLVDRDHRIGHAYFRTVQSLADLQRVFARKIIPLLQEYCFDDWGKIVQILATGVKNNEPSSAFVKEITAPKIPGVDFDSRDVRYEITPQVGWTAADFTAIYQPAA
jgi:hypothetical protein